MATIYSAQSFPVPIPEKRFARNDSLATVSAARRSALAINYCAGEQGKRIYVSCYDVQSIPAGQALSVVNDYFLFRTGPNLDAIVAWVGVIPGAQDPGTTAPTVKLRLQDGTNTIESGSVANGRWVTGGAYTPNEIQWAKLVIEVSGTALAEDTPYLGSIVLTNYARVCSISVYERKKRVLDSVNDGVLNPLAFEQDRPIEDDHIQVALEAADTLWRKNAAILFSWSREDSTAGNALSFTTSWRNILDKSTAGTSSATSAGVEFNTNRHNRRTKATVPCELRLYGLKTAGGGTNTIEVRLRSPSGGGTTVASVAGLSQTTFQAIPGASATLNLPVGAEKYDIEIRSSGGTFELYALSISEYEA